VGILIRACECVHGSGELAPCASLRLSRQSVLVGEHVTQVELTTPWTVHARAQSGARHLTLHAICERRLRGIFGDTFFQMK